MVDEVAKVVAATAASVTADATKVEPFWSKYGHLIGYVATGAVSALVGHKL